MKKAICFVCFLITIVGLASCESNAKISTCNYFDDATVALHLPASFLMSRSTEQSDGKTAFMVKPKTTFAQILDACDPEQAFEKKAFGDNSVLFKNRTKPEESYLLLSWTDFNYKFCLPTANIASQRDAQNHTVISEFSSFLYFPLHLLQYTSETQRMEIASQELVYNEEYTLRCTPAQMKAFYTDTGRFDLEEQEDGFKMKDFKGEPTSKMMTRYRPDICRFVFRTDNGTSYLTIKPLSEA